MTKSLIPVKITSKAITEVKKILADKNIPNEYGLRIGIEGNGCLGPSRILGFDKKKDGDLHFNQEGVDVLIRKAEVVYLVGLTLDFHEGADVQGFQFIDP